MSIKTREESDAGVGSEGRSSRDMQAQLMII